MAKPNTAVIEVSTPTSRYASMVLLVDDQAMVAEALRRLLSDRPEIDLHYCADPIDAIKTANEIKPTVILQDWVMPSIDGLDLLRLFRSNPSTIGDTRLLFSPQRKAPKSKARHFQRAPTTT